MSEININLTIDTNKSNVISSTYDNFKNQNLNTQVSDSYSIKDVYIPSEKDKNESNKIQESNQEIVDKFSQSSQEQNQNYPLKDQIIDNLLSNTKQFLVDNKDEIKELIKENTINKQNQIDLNNIDNTNNNQNLNNIKDTNVKNNYLTNESKINTEKVYQTVTKQAPIQIANQISNVDNILKYLVKNWNQVKIYEVTNPSTVNAVVTGLANSTNRATQVIQNTANNPEMLKILMQNSNKGYNVIVNTITTQTTQQTGKKIGEMVAEKTGEKMFQKGTQEMGKEATKEAAKSGSKILEFIGKNAGLIVTLLIGGIDFVNKLREGKSVLRAGLEVGGGLVGGAALGAAGGAALGALLGSVIPGIGTAIGSIIGSIIGGTIGSIGGEFLGSKLADAIENYNQFKSNQSNITNSQQLPVFQNA